MAESFHPWEDANFDRDLRRVLAEVRRHSGTHPSIDEPDVTIIMRPGVLTWIGPEGMPILRSLQRRLAGPSQAISGISPTDASVILRAACGEAVLGKVKDAVASVGAAATSPKIRVTVAKHVPLTTGTERLSVGRTTYLRAIPKAWNEGGVSHLSAPVAKTTVEARGTEVARHLAYDRFAESAAILDLAVTNPSFDDEVAYYRSEHGARTGFRRPRWIIDDQLVDGSELVPPYRQLARTSRQVEDLRTDWSRRLLTGTRWHSQALRSAWAPDRLAAAMVMLECLFLDSKVRTYKGATIAKLLSDRFLLTDRTAEDQIEWIVGLYRYRNNAVHEGWDVEDDLEVDLLVKLGRHALTQLCWLLVPGAVGGGRPCRTIDEAMARTAPRPTRVQRTLTLRDLEKASAWPPSKNGMPELPEDYFDILLAGYIGGTVPLEPGLHAVAVNLARLSDKAVREYRAARSRLSEFIETPGGVTSLTGHSLLLQATDHGENCVDAIRRGEAFLYTRPFKSFLTGEQRNMLKTLHEGVRRLRDAIQHADERIFRGGVPPGDPVFAAMTSEGIYYAGEFLPYAELLSLVMVLWQVADVGVQAVTE